MPVRMEPFPDGYRGLMGVDGSNSPGWECLGSVAGGGSRPGLLFLMGEAVSVAQVSRVGEAPGEQLQSSGMLFRIWLLVPWYPGGAVPWCWWCWEWRLLLAGVR